MEQEEGKHCLAKALSHREASVSVLLQTQPAAEALPLNEGQ